MKAPEKIWMSDDTEAIWVTNPYSTRFIEYIRKDAFIERALSWIKYNNENGGCQFDGWEEDFKKYMEESKVWK